MKIEVSSEIRTACPAFAGVAISAKVVNTAYNEELWKKINEFTAVSYTHLTLPTIA